MPASSYAVVAYLPGDEGKFVSGFRAAVSPQHTHLRPHITVLSPRKLNISDADAVKKFTKISFRPIAVELGDVCTFRPLSPTVYLDLRRGQTDFWDLYHLFAAPFPGKPDWPFVPHVTLANLENFKDVARVFQHARDRWRDYQGARGFSVTQLTLVRESKKDSWVDLASIHATK